MTGDGHGLRGDARKRLTVRDEREASAKDAAWTRQLDIERERNHALFDDFTAAVAEVKRLRDAMGVETPSAVIYAERDRADAAETEVERLRAERDEARADVERIKRTMEAANDAVAAAALADRAEAQAKHEALREAVAKFADGLDALADEKVAQGDVRDSELIRCCGDDVHALLDEGAE